MSHTAMHKLLKDGMPTFYIARDGMICTHRMDDTDTPVWCQNSGEGMAAMRAIQQSHMNRLAEQNRHQQEIDTLKGKIESLLADRAMLNDRITEVEHYNAALETESRALLSEMDLSFELNMSLKDHAEELSTAAAMAIGALPNRSPISDVCARAIRRYNLVTKPDAESAGARIKAQAVKTDRTQQRTTE